MNVLHVEPAKTETSPGEFVTDGYRVVVQAEGHELSGQSIYQSRFANKAMTKAFVLLSDPRFTGFALTVSGPEVTDVAGKLNLELILDADRFRKIRAVCALEAPTDLIVEAIKVNGNNLEVPPADAPEAPPAD
jgi:hypothetical protein